MRQKKQKLNKNFILVAVLVLFFLSLFLVFYASNYRQTRARTSAGSLIMQNEPRVFIVISAIDGGYLVRSEVDRAEVKIYVPADANINRIKSEEIKNGTILVINKYLSVEGGLVAQDLTVLPPLPTDKPTGELPENPE
ncbi:MAG: hypothetical protein Q8L21_00290 [Candidatus Komeilibacteria bacterium]|nr:hypothetical protein [Candidatus Komeilibacteria bacterium]